MHSTLDHTLLYIPVVHRVIQHTDIARINITGFVEFNSLTPKSVLAGTKNSCSEGFWLAKHKHTHIPTMMEPFPPPSAWFCWPSVPHPRAPLCKGLAKATVKGF